MSVRLRPRTFRDHLLTWFGTSVMFAGNGTEGLWIGRLRLVSSGFQLMRRDGRRSWTIVWPEGSIHAEGDRFLRGYDGSGTQRKVTATGPTSEAASRMARQKRSLGTLMLELDFLRVIT